MRKARVKEVFKEHEEYSENLPVGEIVNKMRQLAIDVLQSQYLGENNFTIHDLKANRQPSSQFSEQLHLLRDQGVAEVFHSFIGRDHRLESCRTIHGVEYINDSKSSNRNTLRFALEMMKKPTVLIIGGQTQDPIPPDRIDDLIRQKAKGIVAL